MRRSDPVLRQAPDTERRRSQDRRISTAAVQASANLLHTQNRVLELIARGAPLGESLGLLLRGLEAQSPSMLSSILAMDDDGVHIRHAAAPSLPASYLAAIDGQPIGPHAGSCGTAAYLREPVIVEDIRTDPRWVSYRAAALAHGLRACWSTPILDGSDRVLGTFAMYFRTPGPPGDRHRYLVDIATHTAAIAITSNRERQERLRREAQLEEAQRLACVGSYEWDVRLNQVRRSRELYRIFGLTPEEFAPTLEAYLERVHPEDRQRTRHTVEQSMRSRTPFDVEERIVRPDGEVRHLRSQGRWISDAGGTLTKLVGICQDVTERKQAEQQLRRTDELRIRNQELKAFAYMVSHDLKGPVRAIAGYARELSRKHRTSLSARAVTCADAILQSASDVDALIEDLLRYARLDAQSARRTAVDLKPIVRAIIDARATAITASQAEVTVTLDEPHLTTWERGLIQALTNLVDNALKFSRGARPPRVRIHSERSPQGATVISVSDNGIGFDMTQHDRLFGLFSRLVTAEQFEGTGAGLAIVKKIVDRLGGRVWAESAAGTDTTFFIELPDQPH